MTRVALGKHFLAINPMFAAMSNVISETVFRSLSGVFSIIAMTVCALVSAIIATMVPFFPFAALLVKIV